MFMHLAQSAGKPETPQTTLSITKLSRRGFVGGGAGLAIALTVSACSQSKIDTSNAHAASIPDHSAVESGPLVLISIAADGVTQITNPRSEMGQQVITLSLIHI